MSFHEAREGERMGNLSGTILGYRYIPFGHAQRQPISPTGAARLGRGGGEFVRESWTEAECHRNTIQLGNKEIQTNSKAVHPAGNPSPHPTCTCGIFAYHDRLYRRGGDPIYRRSPVNPAIYLVAGKGRLCYGTKAQWRMQYVKPVAVVARDDVFDTIMSWELDERPSENSWEYPWGSTLQQRYVLRLCKMAQYYDIQLIRYNMIEDFRQAENMHWTHPLEREAG